MNVLRFDPAQLSGPLFWRAEQTGALFDPVVTYLEGRTLSPEHLALLREYFTIWMSFRWENAAPDDPQYKAWVEERRAEIPRLTDARRIDVWLEQLLDCGIDPL